MYAGVCDCVGVCLGGCQAICMSVRLSMSLAKADRREQQDPGRDRIWRKERSPITPPGPNPSSGIQSSRPRSRRGLGSCRELPATR